MNGMDGGIKRGRHDTKVGCKRREARAGQYTVLNTLDTREDAEQGFWVKL